MLRELKGIAVVANGESCDDTHTSLLNSRQQHCKSGIGEMRGDRVCHPVAVARTANRTRATLLGCEFSNKDRAFLSVVQRQPIDLRLCAYVDLKADELGRSDF